MKTTHIVKYADKIRVNKKPHAVAENSLNYSRS